MLPLPRFYIAKNRTLLQQARVDPDGILAIMCNAQLTKLNDDIIQVRSTVIHCEPMDETHNFDEDSMDKGEQYEYCPKAWLKLKIIRIIRDVTSIINSEMDKNYFKKVYHTFKISTKSSADIKKVGNQALAKEFAQSIIEPKSGNPGISTVSRSSSPQPSMSKGKTASPYTSNSTPPIKKPFLASTSRSASPSPRLRTTTNSTTRSTSSDNMGSSESKNLITIRPPHRRSSKVRQEEEKETDLEHQESRLSHTASAEETSAELSNRPLTVRLLLKNTPSDGTKQKTSLEDQPDNESRKPMVVPHERRVPTVVSVKGEDSDDETASYEYSDSEASDHYQKQDNKHDLATEEKDDDEQEASAYEDAEDNNSLKPSPSPADVEGSDIPIGMSRETSVGGSPFLTIKSETEEMSLANITYPTGATEQWMKVLSCKSFFIYLFMFCCLFVFLLDATEKNVPAIDISKYKEYQSALPNAEGYFKHVFYAPHDRTKVIQTFKRMSLSQRTTEVVGLIALKGKPHIGQITEVLQEGEGGEVIGLCMQRYEKTLKHYTHAHSHHRLTAYQKMDLVVQMLESMKTIHEAGIAHRDLSEVNFMVNSTNETLVDGSQKAELFLIDFGKSVFVNPSDYRRWWVQQKEGERNSDTIPKNKEELEYWCQKLPWVRAKPDHGYRLYRSIQTLPKNRLDTENLPWLIHPVAEDLYSIGTLIWKTFSETEPWSGMLDTDLKGLREKVKDDYSIEKALQREVHGELSRKLLLKFLKVEPLQRESASEALDWIKNVHNKNGLIREWEQYAPVGRQKRHAKALFRYDEEQAQSNSARKKMKQQQHQQ